MTNRVLRSGFLIAVMLLVAATPAAAQEKVCRGQDVPKPPPTPTQKEQAELEGYAKQRAEFGFRHDLPYVQELIRRGVWEYDVGYIPVTPAENRYLRLRDRLELGPKGDRYLKEHREDVGTLSVEDDWPREPYLLVHFKRNVAQHLRALKRVARYPDNLRATRARFSNQDLERLAKRIWRDEKKLRAVGFIVSGTGIGSNRVYVDLITKRFDAVVYFRKHYGSGVKVEVGATEEFVFVCSNAGSYEIAPDGMSLTVHWESGGSNKLERIEVTEFPDRVEIGVVEKVYTGANTADLRFEEAPAKLSAPLGDRAVIDAGTRKRMLQSGPSPGEPPCPVRAEPSELEQGIAERQGRGLPADAATVQRRLDRGSLYTNAELRWLNEVGTFDNDDKVEAYLRRHTADYSGYTILATYPAKPIIVYRFARNTGTHEAAIKRRSRHPKQIRTETVTFTAADVERLEETIENDAQAGDGFFDGYGDAGFRFAGASYDDRTAKVILRVRTPRTDATAYFAARYGPLVSVEVVGDRFECPDER
jgi:hypothetical protein